MSVSFTFHYGRIQSPLPTDLVSQDPNLHSIMVGFNPLVKHLENLVIEIYIPLWSDSISQILRAIGSYCSFTFHYGRIQSRLARRGRMGRKIYIPLWSDSIADIAEFIADYIYLHSIMVGFNRRIHC